ncbi:iron(III) transport system permease protein [Lachnospiraceae bacterium PF1-21]|uniref:Iron ABC transporter permease n=1 Tax=Ohessyouella blattaphilus TaxID=2949333 RepID=A0ABT1EJF1_9FIRM|nr:iron ABC transporter permease [Ohessyouella blattaphilus]MCP1110818.1 iron ABC transporter permease [Ohessyouella blattaphilus]MCR8564212.1 iron ABC transporter permease [Ohessyouella blattaphilus]MDL2250127.1 iron ABC transporter permease [Lachnospiraceae bacterium OttesenSCG-928-J05]
MKSKQNNKRAQVRSARFFDILDKLIISGLVILVLAFIFYPILCVILRGVNVEGSFSLKVYQEVFTKNQKLLWNSAYVAIITALLSTVLAVGIATVVVFSGRLKGFLMGVLLVSMVSPPFITSLSYIQLFGRRGSITHGLLGLSLDPYGPIGVIIMQTIFFASLNALLLIGMMEKVDQNLLQAAADLGSDNNDTYFQVVLPLTLPGVIVCFLLSFVRSLADYGTPVVIGGRYENLSTEIYMQLIGYANLEKSAALNTLLLVPAIVVFILYRLLMSKGNRLLQGGTPLKEEEMQHYRPRGLVYGLLLLPTVIFYGMMLLQYGSIFVNSFSKQQKGVRTFSLEPFLQMWSRRKDTFFRSLVYALVVALVGTLIGMLISYYIERRKLKGGKFFDFLVTAPYMIPGSCFGIGYILAFNSEPIKLTGTAAIVILNMIFKQLSITTKVTSAAFTQIPEELDMASADLGAKRLQTLKDILLPNLRSSFAVGFVNNFTSAMVTAGAVIFLVNAGQKIAVFTLFDAINSGKYAEASMISTVLILVTVLINVIFLRLLKGKGGESHVSGIKGY